MTTQDYNKTVTLLIHLIVMNNAGAVSRVLRKAGYPVKNYIPASELETALLQLQMADNNKFLCVMMDIPWNYGDVTTNTPEIRDQLIAITGEKDTIETKGNWWKKTIALIRKESEPQLPIECDGKNKKMLAVAVIVIVVLVIIIIIK